MRLSNLHTHSTFSDGRDTPRAIARAAYEKGFLSLGFSDHSYTPCDPSYCMTPERYPAYFRDVRALREEYRGRMDILCGLELDFFSECERADYDYIIGSVHYLCAGGRCYPIDHSRQQQLDYIDEVCHGDRVGLARRYFDMVVEHCEKNRPDVIGHFDVITKFGLYDDAPDAYCRAAEEALRAALAICPRAEVNTGAIGKGLRTVPYPADFLLRTLLQAGGEVLLGADAHQKEKLDCAFPEAVRRLRSIGFDHIVYMDAAGFHRQAI